MAATVRVTGAPDATDWVTGWAVMTGAVPPLETTGGIGRIDTAPAIAVEAAATAAWAVSGVPGKGSSAENCARAFTAEAAGATAAVVTKALVVDTFAVATADAPLESPRRRQAHRLKTKARRDNFMAH